MNPIGLYTFIRQEVSRFLRVGQQTLFTPWITALLYILIFGEIVGRRIGIIIVTGFLIGGIMRALAVGAGVYVLALFFTAASMTHLLLFLF